MATSVMRSSPESEEGGRLGGEGSTTTTRTTSTTRIGSTGDPDPHHRHPPPSSSHPSSTSHSYASFCGGRRGPLPYCSRMSPKNTGQRGELATDGDHPANNNEQLSLQSKQTTSTDDQTFRATNSATTTSTVTIVEPIYHTSSTMSGTPSQLSLEEVLALPDYQTRVEYGVKLGFKEELVQISLMKLGSLADDDQLLNELIKLRSCEQHKSPLRSIAGGSGLPLAPSLSCPSSLITPSSKVQTIPRPIVIDGSNVAMAHGNSRHFSCRGIKIAVEWFRTRGHKEITVFVPMWRKETPGPEAPMTDQDVLFELDADGFINYTPSRVIGGKRINCHDDPFILKLACSNQGIIVSNDNYRDLVSENQEYKKVVEERQLMYTFAGDHFLIPDDPLGKRGPSLDTFLRMPITCTSSTSSSPCGKGSPASIPDTSKICPYAQNRKCTYGNKCKFFHPERGNQPQKSVSDRLAEQAKVQLQEVRSRRETSPGDQKLKACHSTSYPLQGNGGRQKQPVMRTKSGAPILPTPISSAAVATHEVLGRSNSCRDGSRGYGHGASPSSTTSSSSSHLHQHKPLGASISARAYSSSSCADLKYDGSHSFDHPGYHPALPQHHHHLHGHSAFLKGIHPQVSSVHLLQSQQQHQHTLPHHSLLGHQEHSAIGKRFSDPEKLILSREDSGSYSKATSDSGEEGSPESTMKMHRVLARQLSVNPTYDPRLESMIPDMQSSATMVPSRMSVGECQDPSCRSKQRELENEVRQIRREMEVQERRMIQLESENQFLRARDAGISYNNNSESDILKAKVRELSMWMDDARRQIEERDRKIEELNVKMSDIMAACLPSTPSGDPLSGPSLGPFSLDPVNMDSSSCSSLFTSKYICEPVTPSTASSSLLDRQLSPKNDLQ